MKPGSAFALATAIGAAVSAAVAPGRVGAEVILDPATGFSRPPTAKALPAGEGRSLLERRCETCHALGMILQQRLSADAWAAEVKKMRGWGAFMSDDEAAAVTALLASNLGREGASYVPALLDPGEADLATRAESTPGPRGDAANGAVVFKQSCAPCHGESAEGARGPALRGRPITTQPTRFATVVREGAGDMPGYPTLDTAAVTDIFEFVRAP